jgi:methylmalonyl-CoA mutase cobalamin-binding subunit
MGVLLTTPLSEQHGLGLLLVHALFALGGCRCLPLGTQTPLQEIAKASAAYQANIVILSLSMSYPKRQVIPILTELRMQLPESVQIWVGGAGVKGKKLRVPGVRHVASLEELAGLISIGCW